MTASRDAVVIGGGHNGLVAAAYLARSGLSTLVCERRGVLGGAAVSEHPFGPDYTVTSLSYVVSLLPPGLVRDLRLASHGYHVYPQGPYFAPRADGRYLSLPAGLADVVVQHHVGGPGGPRAGPGSDHSRDGQQALHGRALEVPLQQVGDAAGEQPRHVHRAALVDPAQAAEQPRLPQQVLRPSRPEPRRDLVQQRAEYPPDAG